VSDTMTLRIGMIGPGGMGQAHIERIHSVIAGGRVVAVTDLNAENARKVADRIGATTFPSSAELIASNDVDAVMICSFGPAHEPDVIAALDATVAAPSVACRPPRSNPTTRRKPRVMRESGRRKAARADAGGVGPCANARPTKMRFVFLP